MTIEIHQPEIEALIQQHMASGAFHDVEEVLLHALKSAPVPQTTSHKQSLVEVCAMVRGLVDDVNFSRDPSPGRPVNLS